MKAMIEIVAHEKEDSSRERAREAVVAVRTNEGDLVDHRDQDVGGADIHARCHIARAAADEHVDQVEVVEVERERRDQQRRDRDEQQRQLDRAERLEGAAPSMCAASVSSSGIDWGTRGHQEHVWKAQPQVDEDDAEFSQPLVRQPRNLGAAEQHSVDESKF